MLATQLDKDYLVIHCINLHGFLWQMHWDGRRREARGNEHYDPFSQDNELAPKTRERKEAKRQARREWRKTQSSSSRQRDGGGGGEMRTAMRSHYKQEDEEEMKGEALSLQETNEQQPLLVVDVVEAQDAKPSGNDNHCELTGGRSNEVSNKQTCLPSTMVMIDKGRT